LIGENADSQDIQRVSTESQSTKPTKYKKKII